MMQDDTPATPLAHQVTTACRRLGVGRSLFYDLVAAGELKVFKVGTRTLVAESELQRFIAQKMGKAA